VYITDSSHGYEDMNTPIGRQFGDVYPVRIGEGTWLGHGSLVLPGADIGRHAVIGAQSVVTGTVPDFSVAVGIPARVIRRYVTGEGWVRVNEHADHADHHAMAAPPTRESAQAGEG
jgi:acetyltransferase-like isoleucine patch superfamily enzyme